MNSSRPPKVHWRPVLSKPLAEVQAEIALTLQRFMLQDVLPFWHGSARLLPVARHALSTPGKRVRPTLLILSAYAVGDSPRLTGHSLLYIAASVEMIHTYSLIHDDLPCMDNDLLRRGLPTTHVLFGVDTATWAGAALLLEAFILLAQGFSRTGDVSEAARMLGKAAGFSGMVGGQWLDMNLVGTPAGDHGFSEVHRRKTAALLQCCCVLGGLAAGADEPAVGALGAYGEAVGLAFQAVDDLLDIVGDEEVVGKRVGKDAQAGKLTAPASLGIDGTRQLIEDLIAKALSSVDSLPGPAAPHLRDLALQLGHRVR